MACYAAVLSVLHTLDNINSHPRPPILLDQSQVDSLTQNLNFFQHFLECNSSKEDDDDLESRITASAYAAEDVIETHIVDQIHDLSKISIVDLCQCLGRVMDSINNEVMKIMGAEIIDQPHSGSTSHLHRGLKRVILDMDLIKRETMEIIIKQKLKVSQHHHHLHTNSSASTWQSSTINPVIDDAMVNHVLDKLTGQQAGLRIIPIVGMGGIGKTTFARYIYSHPLIVQSFDVHAWVTISQEYSRGNILQVICREVKGSSNGLSEMSEDEMGLMLYKHLCGRRYLIVMDGIWSVEAWDKVNSFFPNNNNGSRIMITTRLSNLALQLSGCYVFQMQFLEEDKSWNLLCQIVFGKLNSPTELEKIGNEIARKCKGLPLGIPVIGGLLKKSNMTQAYWLYTLENLNLLINLEDDEYTLRILRSSYKELPMHLKPCFLYIGIFPEDYEIKISILVKLWVAEGILRPIDNKILEEVAKDYLKELIDRNLILITELHWNGEARLCKIHDLLRDVCLREAQKQKLFCILRQQKHHAPRGIEMERRICIYPENKSSAYSPQFLQAVEYASHTRSLFYKMHAYDSDKEEASPSLRFRLLRVYSPVDRYDDNAAYSNNTIFKQANVRYLCVTLNFQEATLRLLSSSSHFWNLQTLELYCIDVSTYFEPIIAPAIWDIPLLRHVKLLEFVLPDPLHGKDSFVLENLRTLSLVKNFKFSEEVVRRIPNIRKLKLIYRLDEKEVLPDFCLNSLRRFQKLESLNLEVTTIDHSNLEKVRRSLMSFPQSLKKLSLMHTRLNWGDLTTRIGSLPHLQHLSLHIDACVGPKWETVEGNFCSLRVLRIMLAVDLKYWETDSAHFPRLEHLCLLYLTQMEEIPSSIGDIPTLKSIRLDYCSKSASDSAKRIKKEQQENGNEDLQVFIHDRNYDLSAFSQVCTEDPKNVTVRATEYSEQSGSSCCFNYFRDRRDRGD